MKYTVEVNASKRTVSVTLDGYKGTARCCPTDNFDLTVGTELALERAKVAKANAEHEKKATKSKSVMELVHELEKALPAGEMVIVGNGKEMTTEQKKWLATLAGDCDCKCSEVDEDEIYDRGYDDGYGEGYDEGYKCGCADSKTDYEVALARIREALADADMV